MFEINQAKPGYFYPGKEIPLKDKSEKKISLNFIKHSQS
jgi:hypothetical protein